MVGHEQLTSLGLERPVAPFEGLADELEDWFRFDRFGLDDCVPLVFGRRDVSALGLPFLLVLAGAVLEHVDDCLLGLLESCEGAIACVFPLFTLGDGFEGAVKLGFRKPVVVWVALGAEFLVQVSGGLNVLRGDRTYPCFDLAEWRTLRLAG